MKNKSDQILKIDEITVGQEITVGHFQKKECKVNIYL